MTRHVWPIAWSFAEWKCGVCRDVVQWADAVVIDEPDVFRVVHAECRDDD